MASLQLWAGPECTVNRLGDRYRDQLELTGFATRLGDLDRLAELGVRCLRFPVLWERTAPVARGRYDWSWSDQRVERLRALQVTPIAGLLHHGSGPRYTNLLDRQFPDLLGDYARAVAERYPHIDAYTPVNEPVTTARFSALYGLWYPHRRDDRSFRARSVESDVGHGPRDEGDSQDQSERTADTDGRSWIYLDAAASSLSGGF